MMIAKILMTMSAGIILVLGMIHLLYTFSGPKLTPRDPALQASMAQTSPVISNETTMWKTWIGFNASHAMGLIMFGLLFGYLALAQSEVLFESPFLIILGLVMLGGYLALSKAYFFSIPLAGVSLSLTFYVASIVVGRFFR